MGALLTELVADLKEDVPQADSAPTDEQYTRAVKDAVTEYGRDVGMENVTEVTIVAGTAAYAMPADFIEVVEVSLPAGAYGDSGVLITTAGLVPIDTEDPPRWWVRDGYLHIYPTPEYATTRTVWYRSAHVLTGDEYETLSEAEGEVVLLLAAATVLGIKANAAADDAWSYQQGDVRVSKERTGEALRSQATAKRDEYRRRIATRSRSAGRRAHYAAGVYA